MKEANWSYSAPRTEQGSTLSAPMYAMLAADIGKPDLGYEHFMTAATVDLRGDYKRYVGTLYIGGTHPAANGGAWMAAVLGFGGVAFDGSVLTVKPALPSHWQSLSFSIEVQGQWLRLEVSREQVHIDAEPRNTASCELDVAGRRVRCAPGEHITWAIHERAKARPDAPALQP